ncbi:MAG: D-alanyl-D-alanine carboxypeptidase/D-alanyl-D-alanine-endopeptidase, partial [Acidobacteriota bacterium]|nr:D-alanyl-D-alanine carboxypeptidase/D-alanyl-D-alanine-endopeptidase [Acidobacteriota bacterium]
AAAGVKEIEGDLVGDESYFNGPPLGTGWEWDDLQWYYGAPISALTINDNAIDLFVKPGAKAGEPGRVTTGPSFEGISISPSHFIYGASLNLQSCHILSIINDTTTAPRGAKRELVIHRPLGQPCILVSGSLAADDPGFSGSVAVLKPANLFVLMFRSALNRQGVRVKGSAPRTVAAGDRLAVPLDPLKLVEIAKRESPPFGEIAAQTSKPSQNLYTEQILRTLGKQFPKPDADPKQTTVEAGLEVVRTFLREAGVNTERLSLVDGSGLARSNLITAEATIQLLTYMSRHRHAQVFRDAQPLAGVEGTLRARMKSTPAAGNVRAKTGTINNVAALSGYVTSAAGERLVFSLIINHYPEDSDERRIFLDQIAVLLASFAGRS